MKVINSNNFPLVSIISVVYNQLEVTIEFLKCVCLLEYPNIEVVIVDNASKENIAELLSITFPQVIFIRSDVNLGFAGGNNLAICEAKGKYLFFLNNDTEFGSNLIEPLVSEFEKNSSIGMISPKVKFYNSNIIQYGGSLGINKYTGRGKTLGLGKEDKGHYNLVNEAIFAFGAAMMVPSKVVEDVCLMPDIYFLYYEEHDWCESIKRAGFKIIYFGLQEVYHKESMSIGKKSKLKTYFMSRNRLLFTRRNLSGLSFVLTLAFFVVFSIPKSIVNFVYRCEFGMIIPFLKGIYWNLGNLFDSNIKHSPKLIIDKVQKSRLIDTISKSLIDTRYVA